MIIHLPLGTNQTVENISLETRLFCFSHIAPEILLQQKDNVWFFTQTQNEVPLCGYLFYPSSQNNDERMTHMFCSQLPWFPFITIAELQHIAQTDYFLCRAQALYEFQCLYCSGLSRQKLMEFHRRYKYLFLAHSQSLS